MTYSAQPLLSQTATRLASESDDPCGTSLDPAFLRAHHAKITVGLCAIFLGAFGVHKFVLGYAETGLLTVAALLFSCAFAWPLLAVIGVVEGIVYLSKSDADFYMTYVVQRRAWF